MFRMFFGMCFWCQFCVDLGLYFWSVAMWYLLPREEDAFSFRSSRKNLMYVSGSLVDGFLLSIFLCPSSFFGTLECQAERCLFAISQGETFVWCWFVGLNCVYICSNNVHSVPFVDMPGCMCLGVLKWLQWVISNLVFILEVESSLVLFMVLGRGFPLLLPAGGCNS
jgi:hypothetical protein